MIIPFLAIISILLLVVGFKTDGYNDAISIITGVSGFIGVVFLIVFIILGIVVHVPMFRNAKHTQFMQRYNSIMYTLETGPESTRLLTTEISDYNSEVLIGRLTMDNIWFSVLDYDFYYDLPIIDVTIELNKESKNET